ncbi:MAG: class I SAM-dependent methyltransferase [Haloarculaceae archaeon]
MDSNEVRSQWEGRTGEFSPEYYSHHGPDERSESLLSALDRYVDRDARVLELGCSSGRHLAHLHENGYENLSGVDVNDEAFAVMADSYPDLARSGTFYCGAIETVVPGFDDGEFDAVYSVETLQHLHPDVAWAFEDVARITGDLLVTIENEGAVETDPDGNDVEPNSGDESGDTYSGDESGDARPPVTFVNDDVALYYRDWKRVFSEFGLVQVDARSGKRDTTRAFRRE